LQREVVGKAYGFMSSLSDLAEKEEPASKRAETVLRGVEKRSQEKVPLEPF
jgi:hypothetical protein